MYRDYKKLIIWQKSHELTLEIYKTTNKFPKNEIYGVVSQMRRSCSSVSANIVEGYCRNSTKEYINFLNIAKGSLAETDYFILLSKDLKYITNEEYKYLEERVIEIIKMITTMIKSLKNKLKENL